MIADMQIYEHSRAFDGAAPVVERPLELIAACDADVASGVQRSPPQFAVRNAVRPTQVDVDAISALEHHAVHLVLAVNDAGRRDGGKAAPCL